MNVSCISFGGGPLGGLKFGVVEEEEGIKSVRRAIELGINFIDTSPFYGLTRVRSNSSIAHSGSSLRRSLEKRSKLYPETSILSPQRYEGFLNV